MNEQKNDVIVKIMDRDFNVKCPQDKVTELHKAAKFLDTKIKDILNGTAKVANKDNLIVIAALNIVSEYFQHKKTYNSQLESTNHEITAIQNMIDMVLAEEY